MDTEKSSVVIPFKSSGLLVCLVVILVLFFIDGIIFNPGFLGIGFFAILIVGGWGMVRYRRQHSSVCFIVSFLLIIGWIVVALLFLPCLEKKHEYDPRISCAYNLKQLGLSMEMYASDNNGWFPPENGMKGLALVKVQYGIVTKTYICPSQTTPPSKPGETLITSYMYRGGLKKTDNPDTPLVWDKSGNHKNFVNVLFVDGHIEGMLEPAFNELMKREAKK